MLIYLSKKEAYAHQHQLLHRAHGCMTARFCSYVMDSPALSNQRGINMGRVYMEVAPLPLRLLCSVCWKLI